MHDWLDVELAKLVDIKHGFAFKGEFFTDDPTDNVLLTPANFAIGGGFQANKSKFYAGPVPHDYVLRPGDVIVTMTDLSKEADTLGYSAIVPFSEKRLLHNQRIGKVIPLHDDVSLPFIAWVMRTAAYRNEIVGGASGSTVKHTSPSRILSHRFKLPLRHEQRAIAAVLGAIDDKIESNRQMNGTLAEMARAIFKDWFVDFGPTRAKSEDKAPYLAPDLWSLFPERFDGSNKPQGWSVKPLDQVADFLNGLALQKYPPNGGPSLPVIKIAQLRAASVASADRVSTEIPKAYVVDNGDVLFSWSGSLLQRVWTAGKGALNQHLFKVTSKQFPKWFFFHWIAEHMPSFQAIAASKATTMGHIQRYHLSEAITFIGTEPVMKAADEIIGPLFNQHIANDLESRTLAATRDFLLPKLMSGDVRVKDAEKIFGKAS